MGPDMLPDDRERHPVANLHRVPGCSARMVIQNVNTMEVITDHLDHLDHLDRLERRLR